jgi:hypothetical protein
MIWRDRWDGTPSVVAITVQGEENGELDAVILALRLDTLPRAPVPLTNEHGHTLRATLPAGLDPFSINPRQTLTVEVTHK